MEDSEHILVTGGAGFIGSHLVERLLADRKLVTIIDDCSTGSLDNLRAVILNPNLRVIQSTVSECSELSKVVKVQFDLPPGRGGRRGTRGEFAGSNDPNQSARNGSNP